jgi:hypothetical protein
VGFTADTTIASIGMLPMPPARPLQATGLMGQVRTLIT